MILVVTIILNVLILSLWYRFRKKKGKKIVSYWGWILPTDIIAVVMLTIVALMFMLNTFPLNQKRTLKELSKIKKSIVRHYNETGTFPASLQDVIGQNPNKLGWKTDQWDTKYKYEHIKENLVSISSAGSDRKFNTKDDLNIEIKTKHR